MRLVLRPTVVVGGLVSVLTLGLLVGATEAPQTPQAAPVAAAGNPVTPGNFTGYGFDQCETVSEAKMRTWRRHSPFRAVGVYISGDSRACKRQTNLTAPWVRNQLADGWRLLPITLGPQASCSTRYPKYGRSIDPTINPSTANNYAAARSQGSAEAADAVAAAQRLGIVPGSTLFYDLEAFSLTHSTACKQSALWFVHAWTVRLHDLGYASGFYSSAASGIKMLDDERVRAGSAIRLPDQVWIADWNGRANTTSSYIRSDGWQPHGRLKQYRGGHNETHGGVTINIDSNYLVLRTPKLPGSSPTPTPAPAPAPSPGRPQNPDPAYTGSAMADARCTPASINKTSYVRTGWARTAQLTALQCVLKQRGHYPYRVTGTWNDPSEKGMNAFQRRVGHPVRTYFTPGDWVSLHAAGSSGRALRTRSTGPDVTWLQRSLNAATAARLPVTGTWTTATANAVGTYQRAVGLPASKIVGAGTWKALRSGRLG